MSKERERKRESQAYIARLTRCITHCTPKVRSLNFDVLSMIINFFIGKKPSRKHVIIIKMFSRCFFANRKTNINSTALKLCDLTEDVMTYFFM